jgi:hypothetical protein
MGNRKVRDLPVITGSTTGIHFVVNNSSHTTTQTVTKEVLFAGYATTSSLNNYATTGSNRFNGNQIITGSVTLSSGSAFNINDGFYVNGNKQFNYGQFSSTQTQTGSAATAYSMTFNSTDYSQGVSLVSGSRITVANSGYYNLQFSSQLLNTTNSNDNVDIWFTITGSNIANSNTTISVPKNSGGGTGQTVASWNFMTYLSSSNYIELKWTSNSGNSQLLSSGSVTNPTRPVIPSVIATLTQIA